MQCTSQKRVRGQHTSLSAVLPALQRLQGGWAVQLPGCSVRVAQTCSLTHCSSHQRAGMLRHTQRLAKGLAHNSTRAGKRYRRLAASAPLPGRHSPVPGPDARAPREHHLWPLPGPALASCWTWTGAAKLSTRSRGAGRCMLLAGRCSCCRPPWGFARDICASVIVSRVRGPRGRVAVLDDWQGK